MDAAPLFLHNHTMSHLAYTNTTFVTSAPDCARLPPDQGREVAFIGRSNAGKSSALNTLCRKKIARTSKTPGRTQLLNVFQITPHQRLIDLPGYGYAKVAKKTQQQWQRAIDDYLATRNALSGLVLVMDSRHPLKPMDAHLLDWCAQCALPVHLLLTKSDKLSKNAANATRMAVEKQCIDEKTRVQLFSAHTRTGVDALQKQLDVWLNA